MLELLKHKDENDVARAVKIVCDNDALDILKTMSYRTWINSFPEIIIELINSRYRLALESVKYAPRIYFSLDDRFKNDNRIIKQTIRSYRKHNKIGEINTKVKPLKRR